MNEFSLPKNTLCPFGTILVVTTILLVASHDRNIPSVRVDGLTAYNTSALSDERKNDVAVRGVLKVEPVPSITILLPPATLMLKVSAEVYNLPV